MNTTSTLQLGIDITPILYGRGVSLYTTNLVRALLEHTSVDIQFFGNTLRRQTELKQIAQTLQAKKHLTNISLSPRILSLLWYRLHWPDIAQFLPKVTVYHTWEELVPPSKKIPVVATIHDLAILKYPETAHPQTLYRHQQAWKQLHALNAHIIAVSKSTQTDILELLDFPPDHVHLVYEALPLEHAIDVSPEQVVMMKSRFGIQRPYLLWVGSAEPRKNLERLVLAWQKYGQDVDLVLVGAHGWGFQPQQFQFLPKILGSVDDETLTCLYKGATACVYPSLDEGFGLPILESFYHHVPIVTSNRSAMKEIAGNAAVLVDPEETDSIEEGIGKILKESTEQRKKRTQHMKQRLHSFQWKQTATDTFRVYQQAVADF